MEKQFRLSICAIFAAITILLSVAATITYYSFKNPALAYLLAAHMVVSFFISVSKYRDSKTKYNQKILIIIATFLVIFVFSDCVVTWF